jgi:glycerol kinase
MQFQSDILGVVVEVPRIIDTTGLGAAYLAGLAVGFWADRTEIAEKWALDKRYTPMMEEARRERLFKRWLRAVELAKGWAHEDE